MKARGLPITGDKLSKAEVDKRLTNLFKRCFGPIRKKADKKLFADEFAKMLERKAKQQPPQSEWTEDDVFRTMGWGIEAFDPTLLKMYRKKHKTAIAKCQGTSRKKCPQCESRVKIWLGDWGKKRELLCPRCGWTTRKIEPSARI
jgi:hypothetical protein